LTFLLLFLDMVRVEEGEEEKVRLLDSPEHDRQEDV
jgi:hypothetical protein